MGAGAGLHQVLRVLAERARRGREPRADGFRVVLAIEGGGMRGTISGEMALALHELGDLGSTCPIQVTPCDQRSGLRAHVTA